MSTDHNHHPHKRAFVALRKLRLLTSEELTADINKRLENCDASARYSVRTIRDYSSPAGKSKPSVGLLMWLQTSVVEGLLHALDVAKDIRIDGETYGEREKRQLHEYRDAKKSEVVCK